MRRIIFALMLVLLCTFTASCAITSSQQSEPDKLADKSRAWAAALEKKRRVNDNWSAYCTIDNVTKLKRCYAGSFGQSMGVDGEPYGPKNIPFQVYFLNQSGPYVMVGYHTYPGRTPIVRIDKNEPMQVYDDAGVSEPRTNPALVQQMLAGQVARARYDVWPDGSREMYIDLKGFGEAWRRLNQLRSE